MFSYKTYTHLAVVLNLVLTSTLQFFLFGNINGSFIAKNVMASSHPQVVSRASGASSTTNATSFSIDMPGSISAGNLLVIVFSVDGSPASHISSGNWIKLDQASNGTTVTGAIFWKIAEGGDTATITTSASEQASWITLQISGANALAGSSANGSSTNSNPPNLDMGIENDYLWIVTRSGDSTVTASVAPSNFSNLQTRAASGTGGASTNTAEREFTASSLDPGTFTSNSEQWVSWTLAAYTRTTGIISSNNGASSTSNTNSFTINMPPNIVAGNLLLILFSVDGSPTVNLNSGNWTKLGQASNGTTVTGAIFWKIAEGGDTAIITTTNNEQASWITLQISGYNALSGSSSNGSSTNSDPPNHDVGTADNHLWLATRSGDSTVVARSSPTEFINMITQVASGTSGASSNIAERTHNASSLDPASFNSATEQWVSWTLAAYTSNTTPTITLDTVDEYETSDTTPTLEFTGYDPDMDDLTYNIQIDLNNTFDSDNSNTVVSDNFDDNSVDTNKWSYYNGSTYVVEESQLLKINTTTGNRHDGVSTVNQYDMTGKAVAVEIVDAGNMSIYGYESFPLNASVDDDNLVGYTLSENSLAADSITNGNLLTLASITYNSTTMRWIRIMEDSGTTYWQYSADNQNWTTLANTTNPINLTNVSFDLIAGTWQSVGQTTSLHLDNFYLGGAAGPMIDKYSETDSGFANIDTPADTDPFNSDEMIGYTVQNDDELDADIYYWRVRVKDPSGVNQWSSWSETRTFEIISGSISITITTDGAVSYGTLGSNQTVSTISLTDTQTVRNDSSSVIDLNIKTSAPSGWSLGSSAATDIFVHEFSTNSGSNWTKFITADSYQSFYSNLAVDATQNFDLRFTSPDPSTTSSEKTITVTIQAVAN